MRRARARPRLQPPERLARASSSCSPGPAANFLLAIVLFWALFVVGMPGDEAGARRRPRRTRPRRWPASPTATPSSPSATTRCSPGTTCTGAAQGGGEAQHACRSRSRAPAAARGTARSTCRRTTADDLDGTLLGKLGLRPYMPHAPAVLGSVLPKRSGERAGLRAGDRVVARRRQAGGDLGRVHRRSCARAPSKPLRLEVERARHALRAHAPRPTPTARARARIGLPGRGGGRGAASASYERMTHDACATARSTAMPKAAYKVWDLSIFSLKLLGRMIMGDVSWKNLSGPITIADYAGQSAQAGLGHVPRLPRLREREPRRAQSAARFRCWMGGTWCIISPKS